MSDDAPGTCHLLGCPGKGKVDHHVLGTTIGTPSEETWRATSQPQYCLGYPQVGVDISSLDAVCSILGVNGWWVHPEGPVTPTVMGELVDQHKAECTNRGIPS